MLSNYDESITCSYYKLLHTDNWQIQIFSQSCNNSGHYMQFLTLIDSILTVANYKSCWNDKHLNKIVDLVQFMMKCCWNPKT